MVNRSSPRPTRGPDGRGRGPLIYLALAPVALIAAGGVWAALQIAGSSMAGEDAGAGAAPVATPEATAGVLELARSLLLKQRPEQADVVLAEAVRADPADQQLRLLWAETLLQLDRGEEAYAQYEHAIFLGPDHPEYRHAAGTVASALGLVEDAEAHYAVAQTLAPANAKHPLYRAQLQRRLGRNDEARANLMIAANLDPDLALAWGSLAALALEDNRLHIALQHIQNARALEPGRTIWRVTEAKARRALGRPAEAAQVLYAVPRDERIADPTLMMELALCHGALGEPERAAELYMEAVRRLPKRGEYAYEAALWLERAGRLEDAAFWASAAVQLGCADAGELEDRLRGAPGAAPAEARAGSPRRP